MLQGHRGSLTLFGEAAVTGPPGTYTPDADVCDYCYLQGVKRGLVSIGPDGDDGRSLAPAGLASADTLVLNYDLQDWVGLLCAFGERWIFYVAYDLRFGVPHPPFSFRCFAYPERSDVDAKEEDILDQPDVVAFRVFIEEHIKANI